LPRDDSNIVELVKRAARDVVRNDHMYSTFFTGVVVAVDPLEIQLDQQTIIKDSQIILARCVTEYEYDMTIHHTTKLESEHTHEVPIPSLTVTPDGTSVPPAIGASLPSTTQSLPTVPTEHEHKYDGRKSFIVHNELLVDEVVILVRVQGRDSPKYIVLERVGDKKGIEDIDAAGGEEEPEGE